MKRILTASLALLITLTTIGQIDTVKQRILLLGDGGDVQNGKHPVVDWVAKNVDLNDQRNTVIFLGDNIYPYGLPTQGEADYSFSKEILDYQINILKGKKARAYFVMGNHDWMNGKMGGWIRVQNQVDYINGLQLSNVEAWPLNGCPGPITVEIDTQVVVVLADSQWFLYVHEKPGPGSNCQTKSLDEFTTSLSEIVNTHKNQLLVFAMHHPLLSIGVHGGAYDWRHHLFPLAEAVKGLYIPMPIIGSIYPVARGVFGNIQDNNHPAYRSMAKEIEDVLKEHPTAVAVGGHDHSLQLLQKEKLTYIVSGSAARLSRIKKPNKHTLFAEVNFGFAMLEVTKSGKVISKFYSIESKSLDDPIFEKEIMVLQKSAPLPSKDTVGKLPGYVTVPANPKLEETFFRNIFSGRNYRREWTTPVTIPVLDLGKEQGGLKPVRKGGGKQTKSLRVEDKNGKEWALRSIEKFPDAAIPPDLRHTVAQDIVEQGIAASYPYASLSYNAFAEAVGLPILRKKLLYIPDDPRLERFRPEFANSLAVLEEREPADVKKTYNTDELILRLAKDNDDHVDQRMVLKARLVDNFIMDFDRHEDQWRWATRDTGKGKIYYPISRDHDQAFFINGGFIASLGSKPWFIPEIQGFRAKTRNIKTFNRPARNLDRFFLTELSEEQWNRQIDSFLVSMTDDVIEKALKEQPKEIQSYRMQNIINTLKEKRKYFKDDMMDYYRFISKEVTVVGSDDREQFLIDKKDGNVHIQVHKISKTGELSSKIYDRLFVPTVTEELRLFGLNGDDKFVMEGGDSKIKIRLIGGSGKDSFINNGTAGKILIYDATFEENAIVGNKGYQDEMSKHPEVNRYERLNYKYDIVQPGVVVAYNVDDGVFLGGELEVITHGFRKEPYQMRHSIRASHALNTSSFRFNYDADFIRLVGRHDLLIRSQARAPINVTNFFGFGNNTVFDETKPGSEKFYRIRYDLIDFSALMRMHLQSWMRVNYGLAFQHFRVESKPNADKFIASQNHNGLASTTLYEPKFYAGGHLKLDINSKNNQVIPTRGFVMDLNVRPLIGLGAGSDFVTRADLDMRIFSSLFALPRFVLGMRFGYGRTLFTDDLEIPHAYYLGGTENLRGYRRDRFAGSTAMYNNMELRFKVADFSTYLVPGSIGLLAFHDVGQVRMKNEDPKGWHTGYGGGIWLAPVKRFIFTASLCYSEEEKNLPYITFGFQF